MIARYTASFSSALAVTFGLLFLMQLMIATGESPLTDAKVVRLVDFVRVERTPPPEEIRPLEPPPPVTKRPVMPTTPLDGGQGPVVEVPDPTPPVAPGRRVTGSLLVDGDFLPIIKVLPSYPMAAITRELEGYVIVEFTVTRTGTVSDVVVVESTHRIFEKAAIDAAYKFKYRPRIIDGEAIEVHGVLNKLTFVLDS